MKHSSVKLNTPCEFINITKINPLISKCQIKVCYVGDDPNRNKSVITKEFAKELAQSLPGSPIVGYFSEETGDYLEHERTLEIKDNRLILKDITKPYGFVDINAKCWFQKFLDDGTDEREYLMTEGYVWTGQYPESQRIIEQGNNQSMELDEQTLSGTWTKNEKGNPQFFIINEAIISKLCILGEEEEPCFEGSQITKVQFSLDDDFKSEIFSMMNKIQELLDKGGVNTVFNTYAVEIGDALWQALYNYLETTFPRDLEEGECECYRCSKYGIESIWEEETQKFAIVKNRADGKLYRLDFSWTEEGFGSENTLVEVEATYVPVSEEPVFALEAVEAFEAERYKKQEEEEVCDKCGKPVSECTCEEEEEDDKPKTYSAEEYETLQANYSELQTSYSALEASTNGLQEQINSLTAQLAELTSFRQEAERKDKQAMIDSFYMLSDEDKQDVVNNIDTYSIDEIESKLSVICVRNKVSFSLEEETPGVVTYSVGNTDNDTVPAWIKAVQATQNSLEQ